MEELDRPLQVYKDLEDARKIARAALIKKVQELAKEGHSLYALAKATGYTQPTIKEWVTK